MPETRDEYERGQREIGQWKRKTPKEMKQARRIQELIDWVKRNGWVQEGDFLRHTMHRYDVTKQQAKKYLRDPTFTKYVREIRAS